ncbi:hypothetical protein M5585_25260 [Serratia ureilytica]
MRQRSRHLTWQPGADFHTLPVADITSPAQLQHFFFNETGALKQGAMPSHERWST